VPPLKLKNLEVADLLLVPEWRAARFATLMVGRSAALFAWRPLRLRGVLFVKVLPLFRCGRNLAIANSVTRKAG